MGTGVVAVNSLHVSACLQLAAFLSDPKNRSPEGYLMINHKPFPGYDQYNRVHGKFHPSLQAVQTTQLQGKESVAFALTRLRPLSELFVMVLQELRVPVQILRNTAELTRPSNPSLRCAGPFTFCGKTGMQTPCSSGTTI